MLQKKGLLVKKPKYITVVLLLFFYIEIFIPFIFKPLILSLNTFELLLA